VPEVTSYATGQPCWADVTSPDVDAAAAFYGELFGWQADKAPQPEAGGYTMFSKDGKHTAAASPPMPGTEEVPSHWTVYLAADDVDAIANSVRQADGTVMMDPFDVFDSGRMTVAADPAGAVFGIWQAGTHIGSQLKGEPGTMNWAECQTRNREASQPFYEQVFGYEVGTMPMGEGGEYVLFKVNGQSAAGLIQIDEHFPPDVPSNWSVVFEVADTDAAVARVQELGGSVVVPPNDIPDVGRFAVVADPWGAVFQVIT
jgi:predicted enzyme related to lactoylglutathione lyase